MKSKPSGFAGPPHHLGGQITAGVVHGGWVNLLWDARCCWEDFLFPLCKDESCGGGWMEDEPGGDTSVGMGE